MQDTDRARYYEEHRDDESLWGEPEQENAARSAGRTATITVRFSEAEAEGIRRIAKTAHTTYSDVVRQAVRSFVEPQITITQTTQNLFWMTRASMPYALKEKTPIVFDTPPHHPGAASSRTGVLQ